MGLDGTTADNAVARFITFTTNGPGTVTTKVSKVSAGDVRICLWEGDPNSITDQECQNVRRGGPTRDIIDTADHTWTVSLIGAAGSVSPVADVMLTFRTDKPAIKIADFRFQGTSNPGYNGVDVQVQAASAGRFVVKASWSGGQQPYRLHLQDVVAGQTIDEVTGTGDTVDYDTELNDASTDELVLSNDVGVAEQEFLLSATIRWP